LSVGRAILGIDFTSVPRRAKPIVVARGRLSGDAFRLEAIEPLHDWPAFERLLATPGPWIGGFDFPFGLPRTAVHDLGWPTEWESLSNIARRGARALRARCVPCDATGRRKYPPRPISRRVALAAQARQPAGRVFLGAHASRRRA
jgi:hypothetical protein